MKKILGEILLAFVCIGTGIYVGYIYLSGLTNGSNILLLLLSIILLGVGVYFLMQSGKSDATVIAKPKLVENQNITQEHQSLMEKNSAMVSEWRKTEEQKDRLRLLEMSSSDK